MAKTEHYYTQFEVGHFYHVYNRSVDKQPMFRNEGNYLFFLKKLDFYLASVSDIYAFCLLGNHFHFLIRIVDDFSTIRDVLKINQKQTTHEIVSHRFRKFFQSYAMAFNKQHSRIGTLFQTPFKRALVNSNDYLQNLIYYIHANPQQHGLIHDFRNWQWSSYNEILSVSPGKLNKNSIISLFGGADNFLEFHSRRQSPNIDETLNLEDE